MIVILIRYLTIMSRTKANNLSCVMCRGSSSVL